MPLIRGFGGSTAPQLCEQVETLTTTTGNLTASISWTHPAQDQDDSFVGTRIVRKIGSCPQNRNDGTVLYEGTGFSCNDSGLADGTTYYYRAFAYNAKGKYQNSMRFVNFTAIGTIPLSSIPEGGLVAISENGTNAIFYVAKHDYESGNNGNGRTLLVRKYIYSKRVFRNSGNLYNGSQIDSFLKGTYYGYFSASIQNAMGNTVIPVTTSTGSILAKTGTIERPIFLLSTTEYGVSGGKTEGSELPIASTLRKTSYNGTYTAHWTRTPLYSGAEYVYYLNTSGSVTNMAATNSSGCRPAFTLPSTTPFSPVQNSDGAYEVNL